MRPGISSLIAIALPRGNESLAVSDINGAVAFIDPATRRRRALHTPTVGTLGGPVASAPDGSRLAVAGYDSQGGFIELFDPRTPRRLAQLRLNIFYSQVESVLFTPDSTGAAPAGQRSGGGERPLARGRTNRSSAPA